MDELADNNPTIQEVTPSVPLTPPMTRGPQLAKPSQWPGVIGIISIVMGSLAALRGCIGAVVAPIISVVAGQLPEEGAAVLEPMKELMGWMIFNGIATTLVAVMLIVGGSGLIKRRPWGRRVCMIWSVLKMILVMVSSVLSFFIFRENMEAVLQQQGTAGLPPFFAIMMKTSGAFGMLFGIVWGWALPVFMLVWFSRQKIRTEVSGWDLPEHDSAADATPNLEG